MALAEISVIPLGTPTASLGDWISEAVKVLEKENIKYEISPMGTLIEAEISDVLRVANKMHESVFEKGITRVVTTVTIDD
jgi:uncharacterized protein (TIGR00106 family)